MMNCTKFLLIGTLFAGATASAFASPLTTGSIDIDGTYKVTGSGGSSGADYTANPTSATNGTGILAGLDGFDNVVLSQTFTLTNIKAGAGELLFTISKGGSVVEFFATSYTKSGSTFTYTGYLTANNGQSSLATFIETEGASDGDQGNFYDGVLTVTPEPSSVVLVGTGMLFAGGMFISLRRRSLI